MELFTKYLAPLLLVLIQAQCFGQKVIWSLPQKQSFNNNDCDVIYCDGKETIVFNSENRPSPSTKSGKVHNLQKFDETLNSILKTDCSIKIGDEDLNVLWGFNHGGNLYLLLADYDSKAESVTYYYQRFNRSTLELEGNPQSIVSDVMKRREAPCFPSIIESPDSSVMAISIRSGKYSPRSNSLSLSLFDRSMGQLASKTITLPYQGMQCEVLSLRIDNQGNSYLLVQHWKSKGPWPGKASEVEFFLHLYDLAGNPQKVFPIKVNGVFPTLATLNEVSQDRILCSGFYSKVDPETIQGTFSIVIDTKTMTIVQQSSNEFDREFLCNGLTERQMKQMDARIERGKEVGLEGYFIHTSKTLSNNHTVLLAERLLIDVGEKTTSWYYLTILVVHFDENGKVLWMKKIPKRQGARGETFHCSYLTVQVDDDIHLIYNDAASNLGRSLDAPQRSYEMAGQFGIVVDLKITPSGDISRTKLFSNEAISYMCFPSRSTQVGPRQAILHAKSLMDYQIGLITY